MSMPLVFVAVSFGLGVLLGSALRLVFHLERRVSILLAGPLLTALVSSYWGRIDGILLAACSLGLLGIFLGDYLYGRCVDVNSGEPEKEGPE